MGGTRPPSRAVLVAAAALAMSCAPKGSDGAAEGADGAQCTGKCDGAPGDLVNLMKEPDKTDFEDWLSVGVDYATGKLNDQFRYANSGARASVRADNATLFATEDVAEDEPRVSNLDQLVTGLARRYGERELTTQVNRIRREYLRSSSEHRFYGETNFRVRGGFRQDARLDLPAIEWADGDEGRLRLGFNWGRRMKGMVVAPYGSKSEALAHGNSFKALFDRRGYLFGRSYEEIRDMKPGETAAWSGSGRMGFRFGGSAPVFVTDIATGLVYNVVVGGGLEVAAETNKMDIQWTKLEGNELVVDVGFRAKERNGINFHVRGSPGFDSLIDYQIEAAGLSLDVGGLAEDAFKSLIDRRIRQFRASVQYTEEDMRMSIARVRFHLDELRSGDFEPRALKQALARAIYYGDLRPAQELFAAGHDGVEVDFELARSGHTQVDRAGLSFLGMRFFYSEVERQGHSLVKTPDAVRSLLYDYLEHDSGLFWWSRGYARTVLGGLQYTGDGAPEGQAGFFLQIRDQDAKIDTSKVLDHTDGIMLALGQEDMLRWVDGRGYVVQQRANSICSRLREKMLADHEFDPNDKYRYCRNFLFDSVYQKPDDIAALEQRSTKWRQTRQDLLADIEQAADRLPEGKARMLREAGKLRVATQSSALQTPIQGPDLKLVTDTRFDDGTLGALMSQSGEQFRGALERYIKYAAVPRSEAPFMLDRNERPQVLEENADVLRRMQRLWEQYRQRYNRFVGLEEAELEGIGKLGKRGMVITFSSELGEDVRGELNPLPDGEQSEGETEGKATVRQMYESATMTSMAHRRSQIFGELFTELVEAADELDDDESLLTLPGERTITYALLQLVPDDKLDLRFRVKHEQSGEAFRQVGYRSFNEAVRGAEVGFGGEIFNIEALTRRN
jgi:hypothetical protein